MEIVRRKRLSEGEPVAGADLSRLVGNRDNWYGRWQGWKTEPLWEDVLTVCAELRINPSDAMGSKFECDCQPPTKKDIKKRATHRKAKK